MSMPFPIASDLFTIRPFRDADAGTMPTIFRRVLEVLGARHYTPEQVRAWAALAPPSDAFLERARNGRSVWIAADADGQASAYADLRPDGTIDHLNCAPSAAGRGIDAALVLTLEAAARSKGLGRLRTKTSEGARALFERLGWRTVRRQHVEHDGIALPNDIMECELPSMPADAAPSPTAEAMMAEFIAAGMIGASTGGNTTAHQVVALGDGPAMADELTALVLAGPKRATAGLFASLRRGRADARGGRACRSRGRVGRAAGGVAHARGARGSYRRRGRSVRVGRGRGGPHACRWLAMHRRYFAGAAEREGFAFHERLPTMFERFTVVWSPEHAD